MFKTKKFYPTLCKWQSKLPSSVGDLTNKENHVTGIVIPPQIDPKLPYYSYKTRFRNQANEVNDLGLLVMTYMFLSIRATHVLQFAQCHHMILNVKIQVPFVFQI